MKEIETSSQAVDQAMELGILLGRRQAFGIVAGRCTAAQVDAMRRMRDSKLYLCVAPDWASYCPKVMKMTGRNANRLIAVLNEHGPGYFDLAQLTGITPEAYRAIAPAVQSDGIHVDGEIIALIPENAEKAAEAVVRLQAQAEAEAGGAARQSAASQIAAAERRGRQFAGACASLAAAGLSTAHKETLLKAIQEVRVELTRIEIAMR